jgi:predicted AAA+ superfamily ATPase
MAHVHGNIGQIEAVPRYWSTDHPRYEVDYIIQRDNEIIPVEVKSEGNIESTSLKKYKEKNGEKIKLRVRFSMQNLKLDNDLLNIPLYLADQADRLIGLALEAVKEAKKKY